MSYSIEYNKKIYYLENEMKEKTYFLFVRQGDNNVYDHNNLRAKSWNLVEVGSEKDLWKVIGCRLGAVNGGGLQKAVGWDTRYYTEEEYIKEYRTKFKNTKPLETMLGAFYIEADICLRETFKNEAELPIKEKLTAFIDNYCMKQSGRYYYDSTLIRYTLNIRDISTLEDFLLHMPRGLKDDYYATFRINKI